MTRRFFADEWVRLQMTDLIPTSQNYQDLLASLKTRIQTAQVRAALSVNRELVLLYGGIGREIRSRQKEDGWGTRVSARNLGYTSASVKRGCKTDCVNVVLR